MSRTREFLKLAAWYLRCVEFAAPTERERMQRYADHFRRVAEDASRSEDELGSEALA
jgi:hypothetical protein